MLLEDSLRWRKFKLYIRKTAISRFNDKNKENFLWLIRLQHLQAKL